MWTFELQDRRFHVIAAIISIAITTGLAVYLLWPVSEICDDLAMRDEDSDGFANCADSECEKDCHCLGTCPPKEDNRKEILVEASLAYKAEAPPPKQPQKEFREKEKEQDPDTIARKDPTETDAPKQCKRDADCDAKDECINNRCVRRKSTTTDTDPLGKVPDRTNVDPDLPTTTGPVTKVGSFDGSKHGRGPVNKGDPYFGALKKDLLDEFKVNNLTEGAPAEGCVHMEADGKIKDTKMRVRNNDTVTSLAEDALKALQRKRNDKPDPVPTHLLEALTTQWVCFKFTATDAE